MGIEKSSSWALTRLREGTLLPGQANPADWGGWQPKGSDNQRALAGACWYMVGHPEVRDWVLNFYRDQVEKGLDRDEQLSNTYHHLHGQAAATVFEAADKRGDAPVRDLLRRYWRGQLALWGLVANPQGVVSVACCRASWEDNDTRNLTLQSVLGLPLEKDLGRPWWKLDEPGRRSQSPIIHRKMIASGRWDVLSTDEIAAMKSWVLNRQWSPTFEALVKEAARVRQPMHYVATTEGWYTYAPSLRCWDDPQTGAACWTNGRMERLRAKKGDQGSDWWFPEAVLTAVEGGKLKSHGSGHRGNPASPEEEWRDEIDLPGGTVLRHLVIGPEGVLMTGDDTPPEPQPKPKPIGPRAVDLLDRLQASLVVRQAALDGGDAPAAIAAEEEERRLLAELGRELGLTA
jgi:hypothetical protein